MQKVCELFNPAYHQHLLTSPNCPTRLEFDYTREQQVGVCWTETLKCTYYHDSPDGSRGPEKRDRAHLKDIVEGCGYPRDTPIPVEGDGRYNNPLYWCQLRGPAVEEICREFLSDPEPTFIIATSL